MSEFTERARRAFPRVALSLFGAALACAAVGALLDSRPALLAFFYLVGFSFFGFIADALRTGLAVVGYGHTADRASDPVSFWIALALYAVAGTAMLWVTVMHLTLRAV